MLVLALTVALADEMPAFQPTITYDNVAVRAEVIGRAERRKKQQIAGMSVLLGWSTASLGVGIGGWAMTDDPAWRTFHQVTVGWSAINLSLAIPGLVGSIRDDPGSYDLAKTLRTDSATKLSYGINTGLDVGYMAAGAWLWDRGLRVDEPRMVGAARAIVIQGGFLFAFDLAMLLVHGKDHKRFFVSPAVGSALGLTAHVEL